MLIEIARLELERGNLEKAAELLKELVRKNPRNPHVLCLMGECLNSLRRTREAEGYFVRACKLAPNDGIVLNNFAVFLDKNKRPIEARHYF
jgi:Tfp pilus assembly protein PilF